MRAHRSPPMSSSRSDRAAGTSPSDRSAVSDEEVLAPRALPAQWTVAPVSYAGAPVATDVIFPFRPSGRNEPFALMLSSPAWSLVVAGDPLNRVQVAVPTASR